MAWLSLQPQALYYNGTLSRYITASHAVWTRVVIPCVLAMQFATEHTEPSSTLAGQVRLGFQQVLPGITHVGASASVTLAVVAAMGTIPLLACAVLVTVWAAASRAGRRVSQQAAAILRGMCLVAEVLVLPSVTQLSVQLIQCSAANAAGELVQIVPGMPCGQGMTRLMAALCCTAALFGWVLLSGTARMLLYGPHVISADMLHSGTLLRTDLAEVVVLAVANVAAALRPAHPSMAVGLLVVVGLGSAGLSLRVWRAMPMRSPLGNATAFVCAALLCMGCLLGVIGQLLLTVNTRDVTAMVVLPSMALLSFMAVRVRHTSISQQAHVAMRQGMDGQALYMDYAASSQEDEVDSSSSPRSRRADLAHLRSRFAVLHLQNLALQVEATMRALGVQTAQVAGMRAAADQQERAAARARAGVIRAQELQPGSTVLANAGLGVAIASMAAFCGLDLAKFREEQGERSELRSAVNRGQANREHLSGMQQVLRHQLLELHELTVTFAGHGSVGAGADHTALLCAVSGSVLLHDKLLHGMHCAPQLRMSATLLYHQAWRCSAHSSRMVARGVRWMVHRALSAVEQAVWLDESDEFMAYALRHGASLNTTRIAAGVSSMADAVDKFGANAQRQAQASQMDSAADNLEQAVEAGMATADAVAVHAHARVKFNRRYTQAVHAHRRTTSSLHAVLQDIQLLRWDLLHVLRLAMQLRKHSAVARAAYSGMVAACPASVFARVQFAEFEALIEHDQTAAQTLLLEALHQAVATAMNSGAGLDGAPAGLGTLGSTGTRSDSTAHFRTLALIYGAAKRLNLMDVAAAVQGQMAWTQPGSAGTRYGSVACLSSAAPPSSQDSSADSAVHRSILGRAQLPGLMPLLPLSMSRVLAQLSRGVQLGRACTSVWDTLHMASLWSSDAAWHTVCGLHNAHAAMSHVAQFHAEACVREPATANNLSEGHPPTNLLPLLYSHKWQTALTICKSQLSYDSLDHPDFLDPSSVLLTVAAAGTLAGTIRSASTSTQHVLRTSSEDIVGTSIVNYLPPPLNEPVVVAGMLTALVSGKLPQLLQHAFLVPVMLPGQQGEPVAPSADSDLAGSAVPEAPALPSLRVMKARISEAPAGGADTGYEPRVTLLIQDLTAVHWSTLQALLRQADATDFDDDGSSASVSDGQRGAARGARGSDVPLMSPAHKRASLAQESWMDDGIRSRSTRASFADEHVSPLTRAVSMIKDRQRSQASLWFAVQHTGTKYVLRLWAGNSVGGLLLRVFEQAVAAWTGSAATQGAGPDKPATAAQTAKWIVALVRGITSGTAKSSAHAAAWAKAVGASRLANPSSDRLPQAVIQHSSVLAWDLLAWLGIERASLEERLARVNAGAACGCLQLGQAHARLGAPPSPLLQLESTRTAPLVPSPAEASAAEPGSDQFAHSACMAAQSEGRPQPVAPGPALGCPKAAIAWINKEQTFARVLVLPSLTSTRAACVAAGVLSQEVAAQTQTGMQLGAAVIDDTQNGHRAGRTAARATRLDEWYNARVRSGMHCWLNVQADVPAWLPALSSGAGDMPGRRVARGEVMLSALAVAGDAQGPSITLAAPPGADVASDCSTDANARSSSCTLCSPTSVGQSASVRVVAGKPLLDRVVRESLASVPGPSGDPSCAAVTAAMKEVVDVARDVVPSRRASDLHEISQVYTYLWRTLVYLTALAIALMIVNQNVLNNVVLTVNSAMDHVDRVLIADRAAAAALLPALAGPLQIALGGASEQRQALAQAMWSIGAVGQRIRARNVAITQSSSFYHGWDTVRPELEYPYACCNVLGTCRAVSGAVPGQTKLATDVLRAASETEQMSSGFAFHDNLLWMPSPPVAAAAVMTRELYENFEVPVHLPERAWWVQFMPAVDAQPSNSSQGTAWAGAPELAAIANASHSARPSPAMLQQQVSSLLAQAGAAQAVVQHVVQSAARTAAAFADMRLASEYMFQPLLAYNINELRQGSIHIMLAVDAILVVSCTLFLGYVMRRTSGSSRRIRAAIAAGVDMLNVVTSVTSAVDSYRTFHEEVGRQMHTDASALLAQTEKSSLHTSIADDQGLAAQPIFGLSGLSVRLDDSVRARAKRSPDPDSPYASPSRRRVSQPLSTQHVVASTPPAVVRAHAHVPSRCTAASADEGQDSDQQANVLQDSAVQRVLNNNALLTCTTCSTIMVAPILALFTNFILLYYAEVLMVRAALTYAKDILAVGDVAHATNSLLLAAAAACVTSGTARTEHVLNITQAWQHLRAAYTTLQDGGELDLAGKLEPIWYKPLAGDAYMRMSIPSAEQYPQLWSQLTGSVCASPVQPSVSLYTTPRFTTAGESLAEFDDAALLAARSQVIAHPSSMYEQYLSTCSTFDNALLVKGVSAAVQRTTNLAAGLTATLTALDASEPLVNATCGAELARQGRSDTWRCVNVPASLGDTSAQAQQQRRDALEQLRVFIPLVSMYLPLSLHTVKETVYVEGLADVEFLKSLVQAASFLVPACYVLCFLAVSSPALTKLGGAALAVQGVVLRLPTTLLATHSRAVLAFAHAVVQSGRDKQSVSQKDHINNLVRDVEFAQEKAAHRLRKWRMRREHSTT